MKNEKEKLACGGRLAAPESLRLNHGDFVKCFCTCISKTHALKIVSFEKYEVLCPVLNKVDTLKNLLERAMIKGHIRMK